MDAFSVRKKSCYNCEHKEITTHGGFDMEVCCSGPTESLMHPPCLTRDGEGEDYWKWDGKEEDHVDL